MSLYETVVICEVVFLPGAGPLFTFVASIAGDGKVFPESFVPL